MRPFRPSLPALAWAALAGNLLVIAQGAVVRASHAGAGCGRHWPLCNGEVAPLTQGTATVLDFTHRLLSLVALALGAWLLARAARARRTQPGTFAFAALSFGFLVLGSLLGASAVLTGLTGDGATVARGLWVTVHLVNSLLLTGALAATVAFATGRGRWPLGAMHQGPLTAALGVALAGMLLLTFTGGLAAMGTTVFPSDSLTAGLAAGFAPDAHPLVRLRALHPLIGVTVGIYLFVSLGFGWWLKPAPQVRGAVRALFAIYLGQMAIGALDMALLAPVVLQLLHLTVAVLAFALLSATTVQWLGADAPLPRRATASGRAQTLENA